MEAICWLVDHESEVVFENVTGTGAPEWVSFHYTVNDPKGTSSSRAPVVVRPHVY